MISPEDIKRLIACFARRAIYRLSRCFKMTTSSHDGEAIAALRAANRVLEARGLSWEKIIGGIFNHPTHVTTIDDALDRLLVVMPDNKFRVMIEGFQEQWETKGYLSERQREVLRDAWRQYNPYVEKNPVGF